MLKRLWLAVLVAAVASCGEEYELDGTDEPTEQISSAITFEGHDYLFFHQLATWDSAKHIACHGPYHLAQINSAAENEFIRAEATRHGGGNWWIGYSDKVTENLWVWENNTVPGYVNWQTGEPNNWNNEDCAWMDSATGKWYDAPCVNGSYLTRFVCESGGAGIPSSGLAFEYNGNDTASATRNFTQYAVNLTKNSKITIGTCGIEGGDYDGDTYLRFRGPYGELASNDDSCGTLASNLSYVVPWTATYYIQAGCYSDKQCWGAVGLRILNPN